MTSKRELRHTEDRRYVVVDGRRWRATDPAIPEDLRSELVSELMSARRAVAQAKRAGDQRALTQARQRVSDAKQALGERGRPWWEEPSSHEFRNRAEATYRALARNRRADEHEKAVSIYDVARVLAPDSVAEAVPRIGPLDVDVVTPS